MTDETARREASQAFPFEVDFGEELKGAFFLEASGMDDEAPVIEYRSGISPVFSTIKMPGIANYRNITLKWGRVTNCSGFWKWIGEIKMNTVKRRNILITLRDIDNGSVRRQWLLHNAWPTKIVHTELQADGQAVTIETLELACENLSINMSS